MAGLNGAGVTPTPVGVTKRKAARISVAAGAAAVCGAGVGADAHLRELAAHAAGRLRAGREGGRVCDFHGVAVGPAAGLGFGAWAMTSEGHLRAVALLLWVLCLVWQVFSALAPAHGGAES